MRVASDTDWEYLSEWRKIDLEKDTLYFDTFGEWRDSAKAVIKYLSWNKIEMRTRNQTLLLKPIPEEINLKDTTDFWLGFESRQNFSNCEKDKKKGG